MRTSLAGGGSDSRQEAPAPAAGEPVGRAPINFSDSFEQLQQSIRRACAGHTEWEARVSAGIQAALEFGAENPVAARVLTIDARGDEEGDEDRQSEVIAHFTSLLDDVTPAERPFGLSTNAVLVESIAAVIRGHLIRGSAGRLPEFAPDLVYLALMPYTGLTGARLWAERTLTEQQQVQRSTDLAAHKQACSSLGP